MMHDTYVSTSRRRRADLHDVAVVGGGMAGAALATLLGQAGLDVVLIEARSPRPWQASDAEDLRVVALAPSSVRVLDKAGVWADIRAARAQAFRQMHVWDGENGAEFTTDARSIGKQALGYIVENKLVQHMLWQTMRQQGTRILCPQRVVGIEQDEQQVTMALADGQSVHARALVAADGTASPLRDMLGIATRGRAYGQRAVVAHVTPERAHQAIARQRFLDDSVLALLPLQNDRVSIVWSLSEAEAERILALDDAAFLHTLTVASDMRLGTIHATSARAAFALRLQQAEHYQCGRAVLLGDAAHTVHPMAGQGINLGLRDVTELAAVLTAAHVAGSDVGAHDVLARYARRRRSANTLDLHALDALARVYAWQAPPLVALRGIGMRVADAVDPLKQFLTRHASG